jgi:putative MATE family efflux protein
VILISGSGTISGTAEEKRKEGLTRGVSLLTGDPKTAVWKLSGPMMAAMLLMSLYNLVNAIWVAGLGPDALAAVGFMTPVFMIFIGLGNGLGAGVSSAIARRIGAGNRAGADNAAMNGLVISLVVAVILTIPLIVFAEPIAVLFGAGSVAPLAAEYGRVIFTGSVFILFTNIAYSILRGEGDTRRTMYAMAGSSVLNAALDPVLIYGAGLGVAGAAIATVISLAAVTGVLLYWFFGKKDTYISFSFGTFQPEKQTIADILRVGVPASLEYVFMSILSIIVNIVLVMVAGTDAVAVYTSGWRLVMFAVIPELAISTTLVAIVGASFGSRNYRKLQTAHGYSVRLGLIIAAAMTGLILMFAPQIAYLFAYTEASAYLAPEIATFLRVISLVFLVIPLGLMSVSVFQGTGKGLTSLFLNILRNLAFVAVFVWLFAIVLSYGETGVWFGIVIGNILGGCVSYTWARFYISRLVASETVTPGQDIS